MVYLDKEGQRRRKRRRGRMRRKRMGEGGGGGGGTNPAEGDLVLLNFHCRTTHSAR